MSRQVPGERRPPTAALRSVRVEGAREKSRRHTHGQVYEIEKGVVPKVSSMSSDFVYVNSAYVGSTANVNETRVPVSLEPPTSVIREQYWACSKWPFAMRLLAVAVGVLLGAVVGLALTVALRADGSDGGGIGGIFSARAAPD